MITNFEARLERLRIMSRAETAYAGFDQFSRDDCRRGKIEENLHGAASRGADSRAAIAILSAVRDEKFAHGVHPRMEKARSVVRP